MTLTQILKRLKNYFVLRQEKILGYKSPFKSYDNLTEETYCVRYSSNLFQYDYSTDTFTVLDNTIIGIILPPFNATLKFTVNDVKTNGTYGQMGYGSYDGQCETMFFTGIDRIEFIDFRSDGTFTMQVTTSSTYSMYIYFSKGMTFKNIQIDKL